MKKILLTLSLILGMGMIGNSAFAQYSVRVGINSAKLVDDTVDFSSKTGFSIGASWERLLSASQPVFVEVGAMFTQKGATVKAEGAKVTLDVSYLQIPAVVKYKHAMSPDLTIVPSAGAFFGYGLNGKIKFGGESVNLFSNESEFNRTDFGVRFGIEFEYKNNILIGGGYELGLVDLAEETTSRNLFVSVGYRF